MWFFKFIRAFRTIELLALMIVTAVGSPTVYGGTVIFVHDDAPLGGDGVSWDTAYRFLQDALADASGGGVTEIHVAQGVYKPDRDEANPGGTSDREATFQLINGVAIMGGFAGIGAKDPDARDIELYETILSGDLLGNDGDDFKNNDENSHHVLFGFMVGNGTALDGLVVTGGNGPGVSWPDAWGAGLFGDRISITIRECVFVENDAGATGGGVYARNSAVDVIGCMFQGNRAVTGGAISIDGPDLETVLAISDSVFLNNDSNNKGGAIIAWNAATVVCENSRFEGNTSDLGGAVHCTGAAEITYKYCLFINNSMSAVHEFDSVFEYDGCVFLGNFGDDGAVRVFAKAIGRFRSCYFLQTTGPGLTIQGSGTEVIDCDFLGNSAMNGAGAAIYADALLTNCRFIGNTAAEDGGGIYIDASAHPTLIGCLFVGNSAQRGAAAFSSFALGATIFNCTIVHNSASIAGGAIGAVGNRDNNQIDMRNSVIWGNDVNGVVDESTQIFLEKPGMLLVNYSCTEGWSGRLGGEGNHGLDPLFVDPDGPDGIPGNEDDDLHLQTGSPCVDAADNGAAEPCAFDLDNNGRFADDPGTPDRGNGRAPIVDMGTYEFLSEPDEDCNGNSLGDTCEISAGLVADCNRNEIPDECDIDDGTSFDCNGNGIPDECDFADGTSQDCNENGIPDECDIADGTSNDDDENGIPDECKLDCNNNGVPDIVDILDGTSEDCNGNAIPDECDVARPFFGGSGQLGPIGFDSPQSFVVASPPSAADDVSLTFTAVADLLSVVEFIDVDINGFVMGSVFVEGAQDCPKVHDTDEIIISAEVYNDAVGGGDALITMTATGAVNPLACEGNNYITVTLEYSLGGMSDDDNDNGIPDECETPGDLNGDGMIGVADLLILLSDWGPCADCDDCVADIDDDCNVGLSDLLILLANWG